MTSLLPILLPRERIPYYSRVFHLLGVKYRFYFRTPSYLQFQRWGLHLPLKADLVPPSTSWEVSKADVVQNQARADHFRHILQMHVNTLQEHLPSAFEHIECALNAHACWIMDKVPVVILLWQSVFVSLERSRHPGTTWVCNIADQSIQQEFSSLLELSDHGPSP